MIKPAVHYFFYVYGIWALCFFSAIVHGNDIKHPTQQRPTINVAVAANFKPTLHELKTAFESETQYTINIISASTGQLTQQILHHAPFDILLAANVKHPQRLWQTLQHSRKLDQSALMLYAKGQLVFYSRYPLPDEQLLQRILQDPRYQRLAMANPKLAPYGVAAEQTLMCLQQQAWLNNTVLGQNVAQAFQFIDSGNVEGGFVARSQVLDKKLMFIRTVNSRCHDDINQMALRLNNNVASIRFMMFLKSNTASTIIKNNGYTLPNHP